MTYSARRVLSDCEIALGLLEQEEDFARWRVHWVGALALVRAVGHVLQKVDGSDPAIHLLVKVIYAGWKLNRDKHLIFWDFIEAERNNILKQYKFSTHPLEQVDVVVSATFNHVETGELKEEPIIFPLEGNLFRPIVDGYGAGEDARDIYREAIAWWNIQLSSIENK